VGRAFGWNGERGRRVKIAIVDSGIDNTHPAFQDASLQPPPGYPMGDAAYTNGKIIVARSYEPMFALPDDATPRDRSGHGTALEMIAAGETNTGPLATITGVAPKSWLGNYKIFGTPGVNDNATYAAAIQALEDDPTRYTTVQGSSFAAAMVAGAAALVKQANPGFSAAQIKSALVNTASVSPNDIADNSDSGEPLIADVGAGKLNATAALAPGATVAPATVSFGWVGTGLGGDSRAFNGHECRPSRGYLQDFVDARSRHTRSGYERCGECLAGQFTTCGGAAGGCGCYPARWFHRTGHLRRRHRNQRRRH
jgi:subtilisin family serine protease